MKKPESPGASHPVIHSNAAKSWLRNGVSMIAAVNKAASAVGTTASKYQMPGGMKSCRILMPCHLPQIGICLVVETPTTVPESVSKLTGNPIHYQYHNLKFLKLSVFPEG